MTGLNNACIVVGFCTVQKKKKMLAQESTQPGDLQERIRLIESQDTAGCCP